MPRQLSQSKAAIASRRRRQKAKLSLVAPEIAEAGQVEMGEQPTLEDIAEVEVQPPAPAPAQSFAQRMLSRFKGDQAGDKKKNSQKKKKVEINFLTASLPMVTGVLASYAQSLVAEPYKPLAPKQNEVTAIIAPIFRIIERRLQIQAELSEDEVDLLASGQALLGYMARATVTYLDIKNKTVEAQPHAQTTQTAASAPSPAAAKHDGASTDAAAREQALVMQFGRSSTPTDTGIPHNPAGELTGYIDELQAPHDAAIHTGDSTTVAGADRSWELATVARAFKRDLSYRTQNGLL